MTPLQCDLVVLSFERAAEVCGDLTPLVYARLFEEHPRMRDLFVLDSDGSVRGSMLSWAIRSILDFVGPRDFGKGMIESETVNHLHNGVGAPDFPIFFRVLAETLKSQLGTAWSGDMDGAWQDLLAELDGVVASAESALGVARSPS